MKNVSKNMRYIPFNVKDYNIHEVIANEKEHNECIPENALLRKK